MTDTVGYIVNTNPSRGENGIAFDYIFAGHGAYVQSKSELMTARIMVAEGQLKGLQPVTEKIILEHGLIPGVLMELTLDAMLANPRDELFAAIRWDGERYGVVLPTQTRGPASVQYEKVPNAVLEVHSHANMHAYFSGTDDTDEQGFMLYAVFGRLAHVRPQLNMRVGVYGHFGQVRWPEIFSGPPPAVDLLDDEVSDSAFSEPNPTGGA